MAAARATGATDTPRTLQQREMDQRERLYIMHGVYESIDGYAS